MSVTSAADVLAVAFAALDAEHQDEAFARINEITLRRLAGEESDTARMIGASCASPRRSVARLAPMTPGAQPRRRGEQIEPFSGVMKHFTATGGVRSSAGDGAGDDPAAHPSALRLAPAGQGLDVHEESLRETLARSVAHYGHVPPVAELLVA